MDENLAVGRPIAFYPEVAKYLGSMEAAVYYQQLAYWQPKGKRTDGFIYKTKEDIETETTLTRKQQDRVRKLLVKLGWLKVKLIKSNGAPTLHYKPLISLRLAMFPISPKGTNPLVPKVLLETTQRDESITETTSGDYDRDYPIPEASGDAATIVAVEDFISQAARDLNQPPSKKERKLNDTQKLVHSFFALKGWVYEPKLAIVFRRHLKSAADLLLVAESLELAQERMGVVAAWADAKKLDWTMETVTKKWFEIDQLPAAMETAKKSFIDGDRAYKKNGNWYVIVNGGEHKQYIGPLEGHLRYE